MFKKRIFLLKVTSLMLEIHGHTIIFSMIIYNKDNQFNIKLTIKVFACTIYILNKTRDNML